MPKQHSEETRKKISEGVKRSHARRKTTQSPLYQRAKSLHDNFTQGSDGVEPAKVRNFGSLGQEAPEPQPTSQEDTATNQQPAQPTRAKDVKRKKEGHSVQVQAPRLPQTKGAEAREELRRKKMELTGGAR